MKKTLIVMLAVMTLVLGLTLTGCGLGGDGSKAVQSVVDQAKPEIDKLNESYGDTMDIELSAEGTAIVYTITVKFDTDDTFKDSLESTIETQKAVYENLLGELQKLKVKDPAVIIKYLDKDSVELYAREFK